MKRAIYIAGKLNADAIGYLFNVHKMMEVAELVRKAGFAVFIPAIDLLQGIKFGYTDYHDYFDNGQEWLKRSDGVFLVPGWETSKGTKMEIETARSLDIPIFQDLIQMAEHFGTDKDLAADQYTILLENYG